ncbi:MAG: transporter substrate-binding domain-containing protein [Kiloniellales bacterium]|nr:transporter substrate-binding domain-containing protein [Kiloniellales bacterium]MDJ0981210.1 transporter substrate-binding domain-containing protein [Kiloniellales bacterium]
MIRALCLAATIMTMGFWGHGGYAAESGFADLNRIIGVGRLVVALPARQRPPYVVDVEGQEPQGFDPWLARRLAEVLKVELQLDRSAKSSDDLVDLVAAGKADLALGGLLVTAERAMQVRFTRPYIREAPTLLLHRRDTMPFHDTCPTLDEITEVLAKPGQVALQNGSRAEAIARELVPDAAPKLYDDPHQQFDAILAGEVLISVHTEAQSRYLLRQQPSARIQVRSCLGGARSYLVAIAVRPDMPDLQRWLDTFLEVELIDLTAEELLQFGEREELWP